jgi:hypothetical protein
MKTFVLMLLSAMWKAIFDPPVESHALAPFVGLGYIKVETASLGSKNAPDPEAKVTLTQSDSCKRLTTDKVESTNYTATDQRPQDCLPLRS